MVLNISFRCIYALMLLSVLPIGSSLAADKEHKMVIHVSDNSAQKMSAALNIVEATARIYEERGERLIVEVVTNGPGLDMLRADKSPVSKRIGLLATQYDDLRFSACANTLARMRKKEGKEIPLLSDADVVPGGVFRIMELTEAGYRYIRP